MTEHVYSQINYEYFVSPVTEDKNKNENNNNDNNNSWCWK